MKKFIASIVMMVSFFATASSQIKNVDCGHIHKVKYSPNFFNRIVVRMDNVTAYSLMGSEVLVKVDIGTKNIKIKGDSEENVVTMMLLNETAQSAQAINGFACFAQKKYGNILSYVTGIGRDKEEALVETLSNI